MLDTADTAETPRNLYGEMTEACLMAEMTARLASATEYHMCEMSHFSQRSDLLTPDEIHLRALVFALYVQTKELHRQVEALTQAIESL